MMCMYYNSMKGVKETIRACVLFTIFMVIWTILSLFVYANPLLWGKIGIPALPPKQIFVPLYQVINKWAEYLMLLIIFMLLVLWAIFRVINSLPGLLKAMIGWVWSPWREINEAGLFHLVDVVVETIFSTKSVDKRFSDVGIALKEFLLQNSKMFGEEIVKVLHLEKNGVKRVEPESEDMASPLTDDQLAKQYDLYSQCIQETVVNETPDMSLADSLALKLKNTSAQVNCKLEQFRRNMTVMTNRM